MPGDGIGRSPLPAVWRHDPPFRAPPCQCSQSADIDFCAQLRDCLGLGFRRIWPKDVRAKLVAGDAGGQLDCDATFCGNATAVVPAGYRRRLDAEKLSKSLLAPCRLNCSIEC